LRLESGGPRFRGTPAELRADGDEVKGDGCGRGRGLALQAVTQSGGDSAAVGWWGAVRVPFGLINLLVKFFVFRRP
ncbi:MAG: hypothetical protein BJ554DRAFT_2240, partial [Olpidium bornovanus]